MDKLPLEIHQNGQWTLAGHLSMRGQESDGIGAATKFEYDLDYSMTHLHQRASLAISLRHPVNVAPYYEESWPPFLLDLFPEGAALKYIERYYKIRALEKNYWAILNQAVITPPGNIRVPPSEDEQNRCQVRHKGFTRQEVLDKGPDFLEYMVLNGASIGGSTAAGGGAPKFLLREDFDGWFHADLALSDQETKQCWLVKFPRGSATDDRLILQNEAAYYRVAGHLGIQTPLPPTWEQDTLFYPRFDRERQGQELVYYGMESLYSASGITIFGAEGWFEEYLATIARFSDSPQDDGYEYLAREIINVLMGNTDNHGRNTAFIKDSSKVRLAPLYDFCPMQFDPGLIRRTTRWKEPAWDFNYIEKQMTRLFPKGDFKPRINDLFQRCLKLEDAMKEEGVSALYIDKTSKQRSAFMKNMSQWLG